MENKKILNLILDKITNLDNKVTNLDKRMDNFEKSLERLEDNFYDFKKETEDNFENTNKLINQAFEKISENIEYQDKVDTIFDLLKKWRKRVKSPLQQYIKKEELIA